MSVALWSGCKDVTGPSCRFPTTAADTIAQLEKHNKPKHKKVAKALGYLELLARRETRLAAWVALMQ